jgi:hypothetical protein
MHCSRSIVQPDLLLTGFGGHREVGDLLGASPWASGAGGESPPTHFFFVAAFLFRLVGKEYGHDPWRHRHRKNPLVQARSGNPGNDAASYSPCNLIGALERASWTGFSTMEIAHRRSPRHNRSRSYVERSDPQEQLSLR